jgi:hypothetical protein
LSVTATTISHRNSKSDTTAYYYSIAELREQLYFLHNDSGAPHHHQPMPSDKAAGQYNTEPSQVLNHNTTFDILVAGIGRIQPGKGTGA